MSPWEKLLERPHARGHMVQFCGESDQSSLVANVSTYLWEGLRRGESAVVVATPEHCELFCRALEKLDFNTQAAARSGRLVLLDALGTLSRCMVGGQPNWALFEDVIGTAMRRLWHEDEPAGLRAYGEMVGILWKSGQFSAAIRLEQLWNRLLAQSSFSLYCSYSIDIFGKEFQPGYVDAIVCAHTHIVSSRPDRRLEIALHQAMEETLGKAAEDVKARIENLRRHSWALMPNAENVVLGLRECLPSQADDIIARARRHCLQ